MYQNKIRNMIRSILPSKARVSARKNKKFAHREHRRAIREALFQYNLEEADDDSGTTHQMKTADLTLTRKTSYNRSDRREADKVNHFVRWAKNKTQHLSDARSKYYYFVELIGGKEGVIKEHAVSHFISPSDFAYEALHGELFWLNGRKFYYLEEPQRSKSLRPIPKEIFYQKLVEKLEQLEPQLNQILRHQYKSLKPPLAYTCTKQDGCFDEDILRDLKGKVISTYFIHEQDRCKNVLQLNGIHTAKRITRLLYRFPRRDVIWEMWKLLNGED